MAENFGVKYSKSEIRAALDATEISDRQHPWKFFKILQKSFNDLSKMLNFLNSFNGIGFDSTIDQSFLENWIGTFSFLNSLEFSISSKTQEFDLLKSVDGLALKIKNNKIKSFVLAIQEGKNVLCVYHKIGGICYTSNEKGEFELKDSEVVADEVILKEKDKYKIEHWDDGNNVEFVLFSKQYIELLITDFDFVLLSGTRGLTGDAAGNLVQHSSLKLEGFPIKPFNPIPGPTDKHIMSIVNGLPCPPSWGTKRG